MTDETETTGESALPFDDGRAYFVVHDTAGKILRHGICTVDSLTLQGAGDTVLVINQADATNDLDSTHYVDGEQLIARAPLECEDSYTVAADGVATVSFALPAGTKIDFQGVTHDGDTTFEFLTDTPGDYEFFFWAPVTYRNRKVTIHAV
jgi:hypothetical protein